jgi:hypothetical protein
VLREEEWARYRTERTGGSAATPPALPSMPAESAPEAPKPGAPAHAETRLPITLYALPVKCVEYPPAQTEPLEIPPYVLKGELNPRQALELERALAKTTDQKAREALEAEMLAQFDATNAIVYPQEIAGYHHYNEVEVPRIRAEEEKLHANDCKPDPYDAVAAESNGEHLGTGIMSVYYELVNTNTGHRSALCEEACIPEDAIVPDSEVDQLEIVIYWHTPPWSGYQEPPPLIRRLVLD